MSQLGMNKVFIIGQVASRPRYKVVAGKDLPRLWFRVCTVETRVDEEGFSRERRSWHSVVVWGGHARALSDILREGHTVAIEGRLATRSYDRDGRSRFETEIVASSLVLLDPKEDDAAAA